MSTSELVVLVIRSSRSHSSYVEQRYSQHSSIGIYHCSDWRRIHRYTNKWHAYWMCTCETASSFPYGHRHRSLPDIVGNWDHHWMWSMEEEIHSLITIGRWVIKEKKEHSSFVPKCGVQKTTTFTWTSRMRPARSNVCILLWTFTAYEWTSIDRVASMKKNNTGRAWVNLNTVVVIGYAH